MYRETTGDLVDLAMKGKFDVVVHGVNCFNRMRNGLAPQMAKAFNCDKFYLERRGEGDINKLGQIDCGTMNVSLLNPVVNATFNVVNAYTQYHYDISKKQIDYDALRLCLKKLNNKFKGKHIGLPQIGCGRAGGSWSLVKKLIMAELADCKVTVVIYEKK